VFALGIPSQPKHNPLMHHQPSCHSRYQSTCAISSSNSSTSSVKHIAQALDLHYSTHSKSCKIWSSFASTTPIVFQIHNKDLLSSDTPSSPSAISHLSTLFRGCSCSSYPVLPNNRANDTNTTCTTWYPSALVSIRAWILLIVL
jgi:hypothetical protein